MDNFQWIQEGYHVLLQLNGQSIWMELDTGAAISVISEVEWNKLFPYGTALSQRRTHR